MSKVLIAGYYGMGNLGDEIILSELVRRVRLEFENARAGGCDIKVLSGNPAVTSTPPDVSAVRRKSLAAVIVALSWCDILIVGGGGIFQDKTSSLSLYYYFGLILAAKLLGKKVSLCAVGVDRLKKFNTWLARRVLVLADSVSVRDDESKFFMDTFRGDALRVADFVAALPDDFAAPLIKSADDATVAKRITLVPRRFQRADVQFWARLADACARRFGARVKILPFHKIEDFKYATRIAGAMTMPCEVIVWESIAGAAAEIASSDVVVSARLHGIILAASMGIPVCGISADRKSDLFLREIGQKNIYERIGDLDNSGEETIMAVVADTIRWSDDFKSKIAESSRRLRRLVEPAAAAALSPMWNFAADTSDNCGESR